MTNAEPTPPRRIGRFSAVMGSIVALIGISNFVLAGSMGSYLGQTFDDRRLAASLVLVAALLVILILPMGLATALLRTLTTRGIAVKWWRTFVGLTVTWNLALLALFVSFAPEPLGTVLTHRGTWVIDAFRDVGPYGGAAEPMVTRLIADATTHTSLAEVAPYLSNESATGIAAHWLVLFSATTPEAQQDPIAQMASDHGIDLSALRTDPSSIGDVDGRAVVTAIGAIMKDATGPTFDWAALALATPVATDRVTMTLGPEQQARYEDGAWRLHLGSVAQLTAGTLEQASKAAKLAKKLHGTPSPETTTETETKTETGPEALETDAIAADHIPARAALETYLRGRTAMQLGSTALFETWPVSLTRYRAVREAESLRMSCAKAAGDNATFNEQHKALTQLYALPLDAEADEKVSAAVALRSGRTYLSHVLDLCEPLFAAAATGVLGPLDEERRQRLASVEARASATAAELREDAGRLHTRIDGDHLVLVEEDGAWRVGAVMAPQPYSP